MAAALPYIAMAASAVGSMQQGQSQASAANYNAAVAERDAQAAIDKAAYDEEIHREEVKSLLSKQRAAIGASGVDFKGSPLLVLLDTVEKGELDALAIRYGGQIEAERHMSSAAISRAQGSQAKTSSLLGAGTSLLSGISNLK